jgi:hypothetical protein
MPLDVPCSQAAEPVCGVFCRGSSVGGAEKRLPGGMTLELYTLGPFCPCGDAAAMQPTDAVSATCIFSSSAFPASIIFLHSNQPIHIAMLYFSSTPNTKSRLPWNSPLNARQCQPGARACMKPTPADFARVKYAPLHAAHQELRDLNIRLQTQQVRDEIAAKRALLR